MSAVLGIDPGMRKAGYALLEMTGIVVVRGIEPIETLSTKLETLIAAHPVAALAVGAGTNARSVSAMLSNLGVPIRLVDERDTTLRARRLYYAENRAPLWQRLLPLGLRFPPRPIDDYAAELIARRFLALEGERAAPS
jgi:RNase H-fold protein (predicted Holliday junction resolvase)